MQNYLGVRLGLRAPISKEISPCGNYKETKITGNSAQSPPILKIFHIFGFFKILGRVVFGNIDPLSCFCGVIPMNCVPKLGNDFH